MQVVTQFLRVVKVQVLPIGVPIHFQGVSTKDQGAEVSHRKIVPRVVLVNLNANGSNVVINADDPLHHV